MRVPRRWQRERQREDLRWERERDIDAHWRERRFDVHVEVLAAFREWEASLAGPVAARAAGHDPADPDTLTSHADRVVNALSTLTIFGPDQLAKHADDAYLEFRKMHDYAVGRRDLDKPEKHQPFLPIMLMGLRMEIRETLHITAHGMRSGVAAAADTE